MSQGQAKWFREAAKANQNFARYATTLGSGCRQGELLALAWADLDLAKRTLEVRRALPQVKGKFTLKEPKSRTSRRTVTLPPFVVSAIQDQRAAALKGGRITGPVFCARTLGYLDRKNVLRAFRTIVERANQSERESAEKTKTEPDLISASLRFHDLRHTHATGLIGAGSSIKVVSRRLGHSDISITLRVYAHLLPDDDEKLANQSEAPFG